MNLQEILDELPPEQRKRIRDRAVELLISDLFPFQEYKLENDYFIKWDVRVFESGNNKIPFIYGGRGCDMESIRLVSRVDKFIKDGNSIPEVDNADKD
jgi:hypothetical protein